MGSYVDFTEEPCYENVTKESVAMQQPASTSAEEPTYTQCRVR